jgi:hypothetical protein
MMGARFPEDNRMPPKKNKDLGPAFSCRLRVEQDVAIRAEAADKGVTLVEVLRRRLDKAQAAINEEANCAELVAELERQQGDGDGDAD